MKKLEAEEMARTVNAETGELFTEAEIQRAAAHQDGLLLNTQKLGEITWDGGDGYRYGKIDPIKAARDLAHAHNRLTEMVLYLARVQRVDLLPLLLEKD